ncbi:hypothetical protein A0J61_01197 [Choanephora cucurbitarum]|uniref:SHSP domain-containing protein n=1 Tax=Choanephora cucurbitarum TaxID=101091 RepID=A0A1C7NNN7_9FUNG|nr:hypothetical protein A0J61_01197 [Choanephora cucurbitarum]
MVECPDSFEVKVELTGFDKDKIKIELADSRTFVLSVRGPEQTPQQTNAEEKQLDTASTHTHTHTK